MDDPDKSRKAINHTDSIAFASGVVLAVACQLSNAYMNFVNQMSESTTDHILINLAGPTTIFLFLGVIWGAQKILRSYYGDTNLSLFKGESPIKASRFLAFMLGYLVTGISLAFLTSLL